MAEPARRPPRAGGPGRNKSFRKAREAVEDAQYLDMSLEDVHKYFSPDTWRKMSGMNLQSVPASSVQKYFDPVAWDKLQRLGCLRGRPSATPSASAQPSATAASTAASTATAPPPASLAAARGCFSPRSWEALTRLNVVPAAEPAEPTRAAEADDEDDDDEEEDGFLGHGMAEDDGDDGYGDGAASLSSSLRLDGLEGRGSRGGFADTAPRAGVAERLQQYFSQEQWRKLQERGVLENALRRMSRETSV